jgi:hypothetical protein
LRLAAKRAKRSQFSLKIQVPKRIDNGVDRLLFRLPWLGPGAKREGQVEASVLRLDQPSRRRLGRRFGAGENLARRINIHFADIESGQLDFEIEIDESLAIIGGRLCAMKSAFYVPAAT